MNNIIRAALRLAASAALALGLTGGLASGAWAQVAGPASSAAQSAAVAGPPAGFVAPALPRPDETNGERARSQPGNNAPHWRAVRESGNSVGYSSLPATESGTLIQRFTQYPGSNLASAGESWRQVRDRWILPYGGSLLLIVLVGLGLFYWRVGPLGGHEPDTGRLIERFTPFERSAHWLNAIAFCALAVSGLVMAFGKFVLLPVIGGTLFGWLAYALKTLHNFAGPLFAVSLIVIIVTFIRDNLPDRHDLNWLLKGGGLSGQHEVPSARFNAGEKIIFWGGVFVLGLVAVASGLVLDKLVPGFGETRGEMQIANMVHAVAVILMMCLFIVHIYIGTIGMKDAYGAMRSGYVDEGWALEHHSAWLDDIQAGKIPAKRSAEPLPGPLPARGAVSPQI